MPVSV
ncbi:hypothetical protein CcCBS67573_g04609 [Chytriomyces confervae]